MCVCEFRWGEREGVWSSQMVQSMVQSNGPVKWSSQTVVTFFSSESSDRYALVVGNACDGGRRGYDGGL